MPTGAEVCDGVDNDCDGTVDNGVPGVGVPCGLSTGECSPGTTACVGGAIVCQGGVGPRPDTCDGLDNDCDGTVDDLCSALSATKVASGPLVPGSTVTYTVVLANAGPGTQGDNPGDEFTDTLPPQLALSGASATSGTALAVPATNTVTWNGSIPPAASVTITIDATIGQKTVGATVANQGALAWDVDGNGSNGATGVTDDPAVSGPTDPTEFRVTAIPDVRTLSLGGLLGALVLLTAVGVVALRRG